MRISLDGADINPRGARILLYTIILSFLSDLDKYKALEVIKESFPFIILYNKLMYLPVPVSVRSYLFEADDICLQFHVFS